jgi:hypothetical protein
VGIEQAPPASRVRWLPDALRLRRAPTSYAEATHGSPFWIVRYAHRRRYEVAVSLIREARPKVVVDWGAGDGYVLGELLTGPEPPELVLAFEPGHRMQPLLEERRRSLDLGDRLRWFTTIDEIERFLDGRPIDVLACLGVLEHLPLQPRRDFYEFAARTVAPDGMVLLDLPVEYGPAVVVKELGRRVLKGRPAEYRLRELAARAVGRTHRDPRRFDDDASTGFIYTHQGFDHRQIVGEMAPDFEVDAQRGSPLEWAPAWAFNQEVLVSLRRPLHAGDGDQIDWR